MSIYENRPSKMIFFDVKEFSFMNFDFKNGCQNEFKDNNEKSCSWSRNRISHKIECKGVWPRNSHADSAIVNFTVIYSKICRNVFVAHLIDAEFPYFYFSLRNFGCKKKRRIKFLRWVGYCATPLAAQT